MDVYWLEQSQADVPAADDWLTGDEAVRLAGFRFARRRDDWRLGRWTAKRAVAATLTLPDDPRSLQQIEIIPATTGQPEVTLHGRAETVTISISHRNGIAICAVAMGNTNLGCDLEIIEPRSDAFISDYFTAAEQRLIAQASGDQRPLLACLLWSAKESALKALRVGLRSDARTVWIDTANLLGYRREEIQENAMETGRPMALSKDLATTWHSLRVHGADGTIFCGWWQQVANTVRTLVTEANEWTQPTRGTVGASL